ncbi:hypothetical protein D9M71_394880 [compost metagenome]
MGEQRAGGIELLAADPVVGAVADQPRADVEGVAGIALRAGVADAPAAQHTAEQHALLRIAGNGVDHVEDAELVLRNLPERRVGGADHAEHFGEGHVGHLGAAIGAGNADAAEAKGGEQLQLGPGQAPVAVALAGLLTRETGHFVGGLQGLGVGFYQAGRE